MPETPEVPAAEAAPPTPSEPKEVKEVKAAQAVVEPKRPIVPDDFDQYRVVAKDGTVLGFIAAAESPWKLIDSLKFDLAKLVKQE